MGLRGAEAAIGMDQHAGRPGDPLLAHQEIGHAGAVLRCCEPLVDGELRRIELGGKCGYLLTSPPGVTDIKVVGVSMPSTVAKAMSCLSAVPAM